MKNRPIIALAIMLMLPAAGAVANPYAYSSDDITNFTTNAPGVIWQTRSAIAGLAVVGGYSVSDPTSAGPICLGTGCPSDPWLPSPGTTGSYIAGVAGLTSSPEGAPGESTNIGTYAGTGPGNGIGLFIRTFAFTVSDPLGLDFTASMDAAPFMQASLGANDSGTVTAQLVFGLALWGLEADNVTQYRSVWAPVELNKTLIANTPGQTLAYNPGTLALSNTVHLNPGQYEAIFGGCEVSGQLPIPTTPTNCPEPASLAIMGTAVLGLIGFTRRRA